MIEKFTFDLVAPKVRRKIILVKKEHETRAHIVMKILAYTIFYDPRLLIEVGVDMHYKPDLVIPGDYGIPELWIDCGKTAVRKAENLTKKLRKTRIVLVKETRGEMERYREVIRKRVAYADRVEYLAFEPGFVGGIADALEKINEWTMYEVVEGVIGVALNDQIFESAIYS